MPLLRPTWSILGPMRDRAWPIVRPGHLVIQKPACGRYWDGQHPEPGFQQVLTECPSWVRSESACLWRNVGQRLVDDGELDNEHDLIAFSMIMGCLNHYKAAHEVIGAEGYCCSSEAGAKYQHPCVGMSNKSRDAYLKIAKQFGLLRPGSTRPAVRLIRADVAAVCCNRETAAGPHGFQTGMLPFSISNTAIQRQKRRLNDSACKRHRPW